MEKSDNFTVFDHRVERVEVIDDTGRVYTQYDVSSVYAQVQDDGRTLKLFVSKKA